MVEQAGIEPTEAAVSKRFNVNAVKKLSLPYQSYKESNSRPKREIKLLTAHAHFTFNRVYFVNKRIMFY